MKDVIMTKRNKRDEVELRDDAQEALQRTVDQYAAAEVVSSLVPMLLGQLMHMRDGTARKINYTVPEVGVARLGAGSAHLTASIEGAARSVAALQDAHLEDVKMITGAGIGTVMPRAERVREIAQRMIDELIGELFGR